MCPSIGFTVFKEKVKDGSKKQTIRSLRRKKIDPGDTLYLYWHLRQNDCELLKVSKCVSVDYVRYQDFCNSEEIARKDGFNNAEELRKLFKKMHNPRPTDIFMIIRWE